MEIYRDRAISKTRLYKDALQTLCVLSHGGISHGICTNKPRDVSVGILTGLGIVDHFGAIVGGDSTRAKKPDAIPVLACLEQLAVDAKDAVMIGDSAADTGAARAAGLPVALVTYGYSREPVATLGADALVDRLEQIPALLAQLHGKRAR
jgi:phosphoglycolate phosphatase